MNTLIFMSVCSDIGPANYEYYLMLRLSSLRLGLQNCWRIPHIHAVYVWGCVRMCADLFRIEHQGLMGYTIASPPVRLPMRRSMTALTFICLQKSEMSRRDWNRVGVWFPINYSLPLPVVSFVAVSN